MKTTADVENITCSGCVATIIGALQKLDNVEDVQVEIESGKVSVIHDERTLDIVNTIKNAGYPVKSWQNSKN